MKTSAKRSREAKFCPGHGGGQPGESTFEHRPTFSTNPGGVTKVTDPKRPEHSKNEKNRREKRLFFWGGVTEKTQVIFQTSDFF